MNKIKRKFETFNLYDYQGVEAHLSRMAAKGWRLEKTGNQFWTYRRAEPAEVCYAVTYQHDLSQFDPVPAEGQEVLADLCEAAGWEFLCNWGPMQIFTTEDPDPVPLETDEALRLEVIHRTMKKQVFPANLVLLALLLLMNASTVNTLLRTPLRFFQESSRIFSALMYLIAMLLLLEGLGRYLYWYRRSAKAVAAGGTCVPLWRGYRMVAMIFLALVTLILLGYVALLPKPYGRVMIVYLILFVLLLIVVHGTKNILKRRGVSRNRNRVITLTIDFLLAFAMIGGLTFAAFRLDWFGIAHHDVYYYGRENWDVSPISIPLTNTDVTGETFDHIRRDEYIHGSFLLSVRTYRESVLRESDGLRRWLSYTIQEPKTAWLYEAVLEDIMEPYTGEYLENGLQTSTWRTEDPVPWGADTVYRQYWDEEPGDEWLLCWPERVVTVWPDEIPSAEEMARIGQALRP